MVALVTLFNEEPNSDKNKKELIIKTFTNEKITPTLVDSLKSTIKETFPHLGWCYTRTKKQLTEDTRDLYLLYAIGGKVRKKALIFCFKVEKQIITNISTQDDRG